MMKKFKKGAASFYIVAFSTLILVIIATSFATVILSEVTRTMNDDLSQSAYDSALAGVEDAKLAYANYRRCIAQGTVMPSGYNPDYSNPEVTCRDIVYWMDVEEPKSCDMVGWILGRIKKGESEEVMVGEKIDSNGSTMNQAYTCVKISTDLADYRANLTSSNRTKVVAASFGNNGATVGGITAIKIRWYSVRENEDKFNYQNFTNSKVTFKPINLVEAATPPTISVSLIQSGNSFSLSDFTTARFGQTNRATMYLVPTASASYAGTGLHSNNYIGIYNSSQKENVISRTQVADTNTQSKNYPFVAYCDQRTTEDFACSATIELPDPIGGNRSDDSFMFVVNLPYEQPDTDFSISFVCDASVVGCENDGTTGYAVARVKGSQVMIDSTGRANDLYRRVETRLETADTSFPYQYYALELLNFTSGTELFRKTMTVTSSD